MQEGLLFHTLSAPDSGMYVGQVVCTLGPQINIQAFEHAWQHVAGRHAVLTSSFLWEGLSVPLQKEHNNISLPLEVGDCTSSMVADFPQIIEACLKDERSRGLDLSKAPLMRLKLVRLPGDELLFIWTYHHALLDGRARTLVLKEVTQLYEAFCRKQDLQLPEPPAYCDYIKWYYEQDFSVAEKYWRSCMETFTSPTSFSLPHQAKESIQSDRFGLTPVSLSTEIEIALKSLAAAHRVTPNIVIQAAWSLLLSRYACQRDIVFGEARACRRGDFKGAAAVVGLLINTIPIRVSLNPTQTVAGLLQELRIQHIASRDHEHLPLRRISALAGASGNIQLFNSVVVFEEYDPEAALKDLDSILWRRIRRSVPTHYPLTLIGYSKPQISLELAYDRTVIHDAAASRIAAQLKQLLDRISAQPHQRISEFPILTEPEHAQVVVDWNSTAREYPEHPCVHELFEEQVRKNPTRVALVQGQQRLTYEDLNLRANQLAHHLKKCGVGPEVRVGVHLGRSNEAIIAFLAVLKSGGAYVPFDPSHPAERLAFMIQNARVRVLITREPFSAQLQSHIAVVDLNSFSFQVEHTDNLAGDATPETLAYVMYTSGSTGRPKGVAITHRAIVRLLFNVDYVTLAQQETFIQLGPLGFDASTFEIWGALLHGGRLVLYPDEALELDKLEVILREQQVTCLFLTTALFNLIVDTRPQMLKKVGQILIGGEALSITHIDSALGWLAESQLINGYGPTESTTFTCCHHIPRPRPQSWRSIPIGTPIANTRVFVLDENGWPCPIGMAGELFIAGDGLARCYLDDPELTAQRFVPDTFATIPGGRLYATGDLMRWREDGLLEFLGRRDDQIKIRGFRIEPAEIESALVRDQDVLNAVVIVRNNLRQEKYLVAYVVLRPEAGSTAPLQTRLRKLLPDYMIPAQFVAMTKLPLTPNGKVDRKALPDPDKEVQQEYTSPCNAVQEILAGIWAEVLCLNNIGIHDSFFQLGGHSLLAMQMISRIREVLGFEITVRQLFEHQTIFSLAEILERQLSKGNTAELFPLTRLDRPPDLPLSYAQQRLWFLYHFEPDPALYNICTLVYLTGPLQKSLLKKALQEIVRRHEVLRTTFHVRQGISFQVIHSNQPVRIATEDLRAYERKQQKQQLDTLVRREARRPFNLEQACLCGVLFQLGPAEHALLLTVHHIAADGWSLQVLLGELAELYDAYANNRESKLRELPVQYADYALWQRECLQAGVEQEQMTYWKKQLADLPPPLEFPGATGKSIERSSREGGEYRFTLLPELASDLRSLSCKRSVTLFMTLLTAFQILLHRYSGEPDVVMATPFAGRTRKETEELIGFFVNTILLRTSLLGNPTVLELLERVRTTTLTAFANQDLPFDRLVEELQPERDLNGTPLVQVMFAMQNDRQQQWAMGGLKAVVSQVSNGSAKFDLTLTFHQRADELTALFEYRKSMFRPEAIQRMAGHLETLLCQVARRAASTISELELMRPEERQQVIVEWNQTAVEYARERCVHEVFQEQVHRNPNALAAVFDGQQLTYAELNRKANQWARYLQEQNVIPGAAVGVCLEPSLEMLIVLLAILKAGGTYVPLDAGAPQDRIAFILDDAGAKVMVTWRAGLSLPGRVRAVLADDPNSAQQVTALADSNVDLSVSAQAVAYVIYTSGSTGKPKGVAVSHRAINRLVLNNDYVRLGAGDRIAQLSNFSFDALTFEIWGALLNGAGLIGIEREIALDPEQLTSALHHERITTIFVTTALFNQIAYAVPAAFNSLRELLFGGEAADPLAIRRVLSVNSTTRVLHVYGPTESTTFATSHWVQEVLDNARTVPIGKPIRNTRTYVLDPYGHPVPVGVVGELYLAGDGLAYGYVRQPDLTAESFVPDPFSNAGGERLYRTGDLVRYQDQGALEFVGRNDDQVKIRGFRIEPGEIEAALHKYPDVREALVVAREDQPGDKTLVAYVVMETTHISEKIQEGELRSHLKKLLPDYMVPAHFVRLEKLPLTSNGKVDRKVLPQPAAGEAEGYVAPRSAIEEILSSIWAEVLPGKRIGVFDTFFDLGGHSLRGMQVMSRLRSIFPINLPLHLIFEYPTIAEFAEFLVKHEAKPGLTMKICERLNQAQYSHVNAKELAANA
jgi:amino acid adenylation domain-containing protein